MSTPASILFALAGAPAQDGAADVPPGTRCRVCGAECDFGRRSPCRFWSKVAIGSPDACWEWSASRCRGYGHTRLQMQDGRYERVASRVAWALSRGDVPRDQLVCHRCDHPPCCNPRHLFLGSNADNMRDMARKGRAARGERHGSKTHPERIVRGEQHHFRLRPECHPCGLTHGAYTKPESRRTGTKNGRAVVDESTVLAMRKRRDVDKIPVKRIAAEFGVAWQTVYCIVARSTWKHLP